MPPRWEALIRRHQLAELTTFDINQTGITPDMPADRVNDILVACRRQATILVGHDLVPNLARSPLSPSNAGCRASMRFRLQWTDRATKGRGLAKMFDKAHVHSCPRSDRVFSFGS